MSALTEFVGSMRLVTVAETLCYDSEPHVVAAALIDLRSRLRRDWVRRMPAVIDDYELAKPGFNFARLLTPRFTFDVLDHQCGRNPKPCKRLKPASMPVAMFPQNAYVHDLPVDTAAEGMALMLPALLEDMACAMHKLKPERIGMLDIFFKREAYMVEFFLYAAYSVDSPADVCAVVVE